MRILLAALLTSFVSAQTTWVVDDNPGPGVAFTSLPAAVAAAASGDTLLVAPGHYEPFHVSGKALTILGDGNVTTFIDGSPIAGTNDYVNITAPPVGTTFRLSGVTIRRDVFTGSASLPPNRLGISGAGVSTAGTVVLTDVLSEPTPFGAQYGGGLEIGLGVTNIAVSASRCVFRGGWLVSPFVPQTRGFPGANVGGGLFVADACLIYGASPSPIGGGGSITAGDGLSVISPHRVHLTGCSVSGGSTPSGIGGAGLRAYNPTVRVYGSAANSIRGGNGGPGSAGPGIDAVGGTVSVFGAVAVSGGTSPSGPAPATTGTGQVQLGLPPRPLLSLTGSAPTGGDLQATQPVNLRIDAPTVASQLFILFVDLAPGNFALPGLSTEPFLLTASAAILSVGLLDAGGQFAVTFVPATEAPVLVNHTFHLQAFAFDPALGIWLGSNAEVRRIR